MQQVIVTVDSNGKVKVEAEGFKGHGCAAVTQAIEAAIGTTTADVKKPEFFQQGSQAQAAAQAKR